VKVRYTSLNLTYTTINFIIFTELSGLLNKVKEVVNENEQLTDQAKYGGSSKSKLFQLADSSESDENGMLEKYKLPSKHQKLSGPNIVFESRISELEAQLAQASIDLQRIAEENEANKRKLTFGGGGHSNNSTYLNGSDSTSSDLYRKQIENLQRDKHILEDNVKKLQDQITTLKESDSNNYTKTQRSRDLVETAVFEKKQTDIEVRRLKEELERQHERMRELQHEMSRRLGEERTNAERRYNYHVEQLGGDLNSQWEYATKLQLELERQRRFESDFKRDLSQKNSQIEELKTDLKNKSVTYTSDLAQCRAEKESMEQEITSLRLQLDRAERQSKVELTRLQAEIASLRQRLDRADADLLHSRRENLRLCDQVSSLEKEVQSQIYFNEVFLTLFINFQIALGDINKETRPSPEMARIMADIEQKHSEYSMII
jgi:serologically defined colon cancer antigen 8